MADYTYPAADDLSDKDALASGEPEKIILGADLESEFEAIASAIATKYDSSDIATQAQAEAGASNSVLMTPLRVSQFLSGGGGGDAGALADIQALDDPDADRILFWDDSEGAVGWLTVGSGLSLSGTTLSVAVGSVDHDSLSGFVANEHINHAGVTLTAGEGLTGGGTIAASRSFALAFTGLTAETSLDFTNDLVAVYDADATEHKKVALSTLVGTELGDGRWYRGTDQSLSSSTTTVIAFNEETYDELTRGSFSTSTGKYTRGDTAGRIFITAKMRIGSMNDDEQMRLSIFLNGVEYERSQFYNDTDNSTPSQTIMVSACVNVPATQDVDIRGYTGSAETAVGGTEHTSVSIIELS